MIDQQWMAFRGTLTVFSADNLAAWSVGGYKALASAFRKCQYCLAVNETMQTKVTCMITLAKSTIIIYCIVCILHCICTL